MILLSSTGENLFQLIVVVFCFVLVLLATHFCTRWIAGYQKQQSITKNLCVVETLKLTQNKYIQLVQAGKDMYFVIAIGKDEVSLLGQLSAEQLKEIPDFSKESIPTAKSDFNEILNKFKGQIPKK